MVETGAHGHLFQRSQAQDLPVPAALAAAGAADAELRLHPGGQLVPAGHARHGPQGAGVPPRRGAAAGGACLAAGTAARHRSRRSCRRCSPPHTLELHLQRPGLGLRPLLPLLAARARGPRRAGCASVAAELPALPWLREAACIGSRGDRGRVRGDRADLDLRLVCSRPGRGLARVNLLLLRLRARAFLGRIPLDLYAYDGPARCSASTSASGCWCCSTATAGWRPRSRRAWSPWPG